MKDIQAVIARLKALSTAVAEQNWSEFTMRIPAEPSRDADIVLQRSAMALERLEAVEQQLAAKDALLRQASEAFHSISLCEFNSMSSRQEMGRLARDAVAAIDKELK